MGLRAPLTVFLLFTVNAALIEPGGVPAAPAQSTEQARSFQVTARRYRYEPAKLEVTEGDLVRIELKAEDIAHSLTIDGYRIDKRVSPEAPVHFEFRADRAGAFPFYCDLQIDDGCRKMRGELVVRPRR